MGRISKGNDTTLLLRMPTAVKLGIVQAAQASGVGLSEFCIEAAAKAAGMEREPIVKIIGYTWKMPPEVP